MKLNYNGEDTYKTEFGGIMFLIVAAVCVFFTVINQFPEGIKLDKPITFYSISGSV